MRYLATLLLVVLSGVFPGCATFTSPAREHVLEPTKTYWFDYVAERRGALAVPTSASMRICAEPSPDVATQFFASLKLTDTTLGSPEAQANQSVVRLAKRTQTVMFLRESLYRLCELSLNFNLTKQDVLDQYKAVIDAAVAMAKAELANAQAEADQARTTLLIIRRKIKAESTDVIDTVE